MPVDPIDKKSQLNQLLDLAEKSSAQKKIYEDGITRIYFSLFIFGIMAIIGAVTSLAISDKYYYKENYSLIVICSFIYFCILIILFVRTAMSLIKLRKELNIERKVLYRLMNMIYETKNLSSYRGDPIAEALFDIRLSRIDFSSSQTGFSKKLHK